MNARTFELEQAPTVAAEASPPPCLIVNPLSFRVSRGLQQPAVALATAYGAEVVFVDRPSQMHDAVCSLLARRQQRVMVLAGDGTVHAIVDQLASRPDAQAWMPDLLVLAGGRSNLTAADLTPRAGAMKTLQRALQRARDGRWDEAVVERVTLRIDQPPAPPRHGFFVGAALVDSVIRRIHQEVAAASGPLGTGRLSSVRWLLHLGALALRGRSGLACPHLNVDAGAAGRLEGPVRVLLATTLLHRQSLFDPYAPHGTGCLRVTAAMLHARHFWRFLPRLVTGRYTASMDAANGYLSGNCEHLKIMGLTGYSLDGEAFDVDPARPVVITPGPRLRFLVP